MLLIDKTAPTFDLLHEFLALLPKYPLTVPVAAIAADLEVSPEQVAKLAREAWEWLELRVVMSLDRKTGGAAGVLGVDWAETQELAEAYVYTADRCEDARAIWAERASRATRTPSPPATVVGAKAWSGGAMLV